jgi:hypothetical protein
MKQSSEQVAVGIYAEVRSIIRQTVELRRPLSMFQQIENVQNTRPIYRVVFDNSPAKNIRGLVIGVRSLTLPDERIQDAMLSLAQSVWHLKDRLSKWCKINRLDVDIEQFANGNTKLLVCGDLANTKKHGSKNNRSRLNPMLDLIWFDTSRNGPLEIFYNGKMKEKELHVTNPTPIPYMVPILCGSEVKEKQGKKTKKVLAENAVEYIWEGFQDWLPVIRKIGIFEIGHPEGRELFKLLFS